MCDFGPWFPTIEKQNPDLQEESRFTTEVGLPSPPIQIPARPPFSRIFSPSSTSIVLEQLQVTLALRCRYWLVEITN